MAKYIVPPKTPYGTSIIRCQICRTLYVPDKKTTNRYPLYYEFCPHCGYEYNDASDKIPLWKYNLIKWWRGGFNEEPVEKSTEE